MSVRTDNEMGQIQKGLEDFLERELQIYTLEEEQKREKDLDIISGSKSQQGMENFRKVRDYGNTAGRERGRGYQFYEEDWDGKEDKRARVKGGSNKNRPDVGIPSGKKRKSQAGNAGRYDRNDRRNVSNQKEKPKKKKSRLKRFLLTAVLILFLAGIGLYQLVGVLYNKLNYQEIASVSHQPLQEKGVVNILLIGNDSRLNGDDGRSDAMILLSISKKTRTIYMTSFLRDMYVEIPGKGGNRLNAAYSLGGAELLMATIEENFDIPVNRCMQVNFEAFANLVDAVDGIDLELSTEEIEYVNGYLVEYNMLTDRPQGTDNMDPSVDGLVHLNGPQALAYCRNRYLGTDFGRTERQRKVLTQVIKKAPGAMITNSGELFDGLLPNLTTNLTKMECFRLSLMAGRLLTYDIVSDHIPQPDTYRNATIRDMSVLEVDFDANKKYLWEKLYGEDTQ